MVDVRGSLIIDRDTPYGAGAEERMPEEAGRHGL
jgi:hypothetical protein